jgi:hypothetical protein
MVFTWKNIRLFFMSNAELQRKNAELRREINLPTSTTEGKQCPICLEDLNTGWLARTPCWHIYHIDCALYFMKHQRQCPLCREPLKSCSKIFVCENNVNQ